MNDENRIDALVVGVEAWQVGVTLAGGPQGPRAVRLLVALHESAGLKPLALMLDPADARQIGEALLGHADAADVKRTAEQN